MTILRASDEVSALVHMDAVYLYHQRYGYILEMSRDVYDLWHAFDGGAARQLIETHFAGRLSGQTPSELVDILYEFSCLESEDEGRDRWLDYVPIKGAWNTWERTETGVSLWTAWGARDACEHALSEKETAVWDAIDGERRVGELAASFGAAVALPLFTRLSSLEVQALKLSPMPLSVYGGRHRWPAYLTSTMPYPPLADGDDAEADLGAYHGDIANADTQFDDVETTLAHLFRRPHPALDGKRYGEALLGGLEKHGLVLGPERLGGRAPLPPNPPGPLRIVELGGGLGEMAAAIGESLRARGFAFDYQILELSPALAARQRERMAELGIRVIETDALAATLESGSVDLFIANEMIGDLPVVPFSEATALAERYALDVEGAAAKTPINSGAFELIERVAGWLAPNGLAVVTEFGERSQFARLSSHLDHPEHSIHFGHLESVAKHLELASEFVFLMDLIEMRRDMKGLATTRSQFRALSRLLAKRGVTLEKIGYTAEMFAAVTETAGAPGEAFGDLRFDKIEDRLMGLVPHEFKALILRRA